MFQESRHQRGSAIIYIFIGIALFGALMFMFSRGVSQSPTSLSKSETKVVASEMLSYAKTVEKAVNKLLQKGCSETQINFDNTVVAGYTNVNAPGDKSCDVFDAAGGGIRWESPPVNSGTTSEWLIMGDACIDSIGTGGDDCWNANDGNDSDLVIAVSGISKDVCMEINNILGINNTSSGPPQANNQTWSNPPEKFIGSFTQGGHQIQSDKTNSNEDLRGQSAGCFDGDNFPAQGTYSFYLSLIAR